MGLRRDEGRRESGQVLLKGLNLEGRVVRAAEVVGFDYFYARKLASRLGELACGHGTTQIRP